jgi:DNA-binding CsgD family transcriptional regulator
MPAEYGEPLTERELEMVALVAEGLTNREIALRADVSPNTVKVHLRNIFTKTGVSSRTELSILALREGWVAVPDAEEALAPVEVDVADVEEAVVGEEEESLPPWPSLRWWGLALGLALAALVLLLPSRSNPPGNGGSAAAALVDRPRGGAAVPVTAGDEGWVEVAPLPLRRARLGLATLDGYLYAVGGLSYEGVVGRLDRYDPGEDVWEERAPRPAALANVGAVPLGEELLVPGGCDAAGNPEAAVHRYDPGGDVWEDVAPLPEPLCAYALAAWEGKAYLFGGWDGERYRAVTYVYDPTVDEWVEGAPPQRPRGFGGAAPLGERIYYVGGYDGEESAGCEYYLPGEERWSACAPMLQPRGGLGLASLAGHLYAVGGGWEDSYLGFNERYSPVEDAWTVVETPLVGEWRNLGLVARETSLYGVGGWSGDYLNRTYVLEVLPFRIFIPASRP